MRAFRFSGIWRIIRVPVIAAIERRAHVHSEYALLANVIVAGEGATFNDLPHFAGGIVPGDGIFPTLRRRAIGCSREPVWLHTSECATRSLVALTSVATPGRIPENDRILDPLWAHSL